MTRRLTRRLLIAAAIVMGAWYLTVVFGIGWPTAAEATGFCDEHPNGVLAGWFAQVEKRDGFPVTVTSWRFGGGITDPIPWGGTFCSNHHRVWNVNWGGEPAGWADAIYTWRYVPSDTHLVVKDNTGVYRQHVWQGHFASGIGPLGNVCYPRLGVTVGPDQAIGHTSVKNCSRG